jgi:gluconolactonase
VLSNESQVETAPNELPLKVKPERDVVGDLRTVAAGLDHPEGIAWYDGALWCGTEAGELIRIDPADGKAETVAATGGFLLGIAFDGCGRCVACDWGNHALLRITPGGEIETLADSVEGRPLTFPNFPVFAPDGRLWVSDSGREWGTDDGFLFSLQPGGEPRLATDSSHLFPNGLALDARATTLYVVESRLPGVVSFEIGDGELGERAEVVHLPQTVPDGLAFDSEGSLFVSCWRPDRVYRIDAKGAAHLFLDDFTGEYLTVPTNCCFSGPELRTLSFASLGGWVVRELDVDVAGQPLHHPL